MPRGDKTKTCLHIALLGALLGTSPAHAQEVTREIIRADAAVISACVAAAESRAALADCRGRISDSCDRDQDPDGKTTASSVICHQRERAAWDVEINTASDALSTEDPEAADLLRAAQQAWVLWRDAKCAHEASIYLGGSLARVVSASCLAEETAARAIDLIARRRGTDFWFAVR